MAANSQETSSKVGGISNKRTIKRKLDDTVLKKARVAIGLPTEQQEDDGEDKQSEEPSLKWRKPRHNTAEGQMYIKSKEKRKLLEDGPLPKRSLVSAKKNDKRSKKNRKNKKKKKDSDAPQQTCSKNPESEKRHGMEAISYIQLWATNRDHWKFEKRKQTWLLKNCLNSNLIDDKRFQLFLEYVASVKGAARQATLNEMQIIIRQKETVLENDPAVGNESGQSDHSGRDINEISCDRARQIIQMLVE